MTERDAIRIHWGVLGEWWCVPVDQAEEEREDMLSAIRDDLGMDFARCPLEYIEDRLFGGALCDAGPNRRHVYFQTGGYSFLAAQRGEFWAHSGRWRCWERLLESPTKFIGDGPFADDFPREE